MFDSSLLFISSHTSHSSDYLMFSERTHYFQSAPKMMMIIKRIPKNCVDNATIRLSKRLISKKLKSTQNSDCSNRTMTQNKHLKPKKKDRLNDFPLWYADCNVYNECIFNHMMLRWAVLSRSFSYHDY